MWIRRVLTVVFALHLIVHPALADVVKLKNGDEHEGVIANREQVRENPSSHSWIGILPDSSERVLRVPVENTEYVLLEDGEEKEVESYLEAEEFFDKEE